MKIDRELLEQQIAKLSGLLDDDLMEYERDAIEGVLNLMESIADCKEDLLTIELI